MIFPGFPGVLSFFQVFQVEWEPCNITHETRFVAHKKLTKHHLLLDIVSIILY